MGQSRKACHSLAVQLLACVFGQQLRQLHPSDVLASDVVRAALQHQHPVAVLQAVDGGRTLHILGKQPFGTRQHHAERREVHLVGHNLRHHAIHLAVRHHQPRLLLQSGKRALQLRLAAHHGAGVVVKNIPQHLHLWQNHASLGSRRVNGRDHHHRVALANHIAQQRAVHVSRLGQRLADAGREWFAQCGVLHRQQENLSIVVGLNPLQQGRVGLQAVGLRIDKHVWDAALAAGVHQHHLLSLEAVVSKKNQCKVGLSQHLKTLVNTHAAHSALVVDAGGVDPHHRSHAANLHGLLHWVGSGAGQIRHNGYLLPGEEIHQRALAVIATAENANMGFQFVSFHAPITQNASDYCPRALFSTAHPARVKRIIFLRNINDTSTIHQRYFDDRIS